LDATWGFGANPHAVPTPRLIGFDSDHHRQILSDERRHMLRRVWTYRSLGQLVYDPDDAQYTILFLKNLLA